MLQWDRKAKKGPKNSPRGMYKKNLFFSLDQPNKERAGAGNSILSLDNSIEIFQFHPQGVQF